MNEYVSVKIRVLSFVMILIVVFLHSELSILQLNRGNPEFHRGFYIIAEGLSRMAIPLFFAISGYLFFCNLHGTVKEFRSKIRRRFRTLLVPYLFWSAFSLLFYLVLQSFPYSALFFSKERIADYSFLQLVNTLLINPLAYQLWFIKDLMLLALLSPLIYTLVRYLKEFALLIVLVLWWVDLSLGLISNEALLFFTVGAFASQYLQRWVLSLATVKELWITCIWIGLVVGKTAWNLTGNPNEAVMNLLNRMAILFGVVAVWSLYDVLFWRYDVSHSRAYALTAFTFFIYVFHVPMLHVLIKGGNYLIGSGGLAAFLTWLATPLATIVLGVLIGRFLRQRMPKFYSWITGGR